MYAPTPGQLCFVASVLIWIGIAIGAFLVWVF